MISFHHKGNFIKTEKFLKKSFGRNYQQILEKYGKMGVERLSKFTPIDSGKTSSSWNYRIEKESSNFVSVVWYNSNINNGVNIALILQYGHATRNGGWVEGIDYINPALKPIFDSMAEEAWKEVISNG